jgi:cytochrome bd ubiquinol oxidase subunit II
LSAARCPSRALTFKETDMNTASQGMLTHAWFVLAGLMLIFYVITDGFDLGVGILSLFQSERSRRDMMIQSIGHVWDANETWLVVVGGVMFGAFPAAYAEIMSSLYVPVMVLIASLIMRGAAIEFRHASHGGRLWDAVFGLGSLLAAGCQGVILGEIVTGLVPGVRETAFVVVTAIGVISGYVLLGATYLVKKTSGQLEASARRSSVTAVIVTALSAIVLSAGTRFASPIGAQRWAQPEVFNVLLALGIVAALAFAYVLYAVRVGSVRGPFRASVVLFLASFAGLAVSLFPDWIPGQLTIADSASSSATLTFMLFGIGMVLPIMVGYNLYQYYLFRGKVVPSQHH